MDCLMVSSLCKSSSQGPCLWCPLLCLHILGKALFHIRRLTKLVIYKKGVNNRLVSSIFFHDEHFLDFGLASVCSQESRKDNSGLELYLQLEKSHVILDLTIYQLHHDYEVIPSQGTLP